MKHQTTFEDVVTASGPPWQIEDDEPYVLLAVSGWTIQPESGKPSSRLALTSWSILDSADCYREVAFVEDRQGRPHMTRQETEAQARKICAKFNAEA